jgi:hypothetical protein
VPFAYHTRPPELRGHTLEPLSTLRARHPDLHAAASAKYAGARAVNLTIRVPILDVGWDDVVHLLPLHPSHVYRSLQAAALAPAPQRFFRIPLDRLPRARTLWFRFTPDLRPDEQLGQPPATDFEPFDPARYRELPSLPARTAAYHRAAAAVALRPSPFRFIPQLLVAAPIDVTALTTLDWSDPPP